MTDQSTGLQQWSIATVSTVTTLAFLFVCLRLLSRYECKQPLWWDDWMIIFSMGWNLMVVGFIFAMIQHGMGLHASTVPLPSIALMAKYLLIAEILYVLNLVWTKLSFLMMYYRIFRFPYFKRWAFLIGGFIIAWVICVTFLFLFICVPVQKAWLPDLPGRCINRLGPWIANATSTIATDLAILILPIPQIWNLQLRREEKIALTLVFGVGFFVVFASVYRFTVLFSYRAADPTYTLAATIGWTAIEMSAGIISACMPNLQPALHFICRNLGLVSNKGSSVLPTSTGSMHTSMQAALERKPRLEKLRKGLQGTRIFYQLANENASAESGGVQMPADLKLRPDHQGYMYSVSSMVDNRDVDLSAAIPPNRIGVQMEYKQTRSSLIIK